MLITCWQYIDTVQTEGTECIIVCSAMFQEVFTEMEEKYGEVEEMNVCDNLGDHLVGNVYVKVRVRPKLSLLYCCGFQRGPRASDLFSSSAKHCRFLGLIVPFRRGR